VTLDNLVGGGSSYQAFAHDLLRTALCSVTPIASNDDRPAGMLLEGCYDHGQGIAIRHELVWGDFFLALALAMVVQTTAGLGKGGVPSTCTRRRWRGARDR
jgi:hypothetical protein